MHALIHNAVTNMDHVMSTVACDSRHAHIEAMQNCVQTLRGRRLCILRTTCRRGAARRTARTSAWLFLAVQRSSEFRELGSL